MFFISFFISFLSVLRSNRHPIVILTGHFLPLREGVVMFGLQPPDQYPYRSQNPGAQLVCPPANMYMLTKGTI